MPLFSLCVLQDSGVKFLLSLPTINIGYAGSPVPLKAYVQCLLRPCLVQVRLRQITPNLRQSGEDCGKAPTVAENASVER